MINFDSEFFSPKDTLECGQIFRYKSLNDGFLVLSQDKACKLSERDGKTIIECDDEKYFKNFLDLDGDYSGVYNRATASEFDIVKNSAKVAKGVRILRQAPEETLFSFIVSQNNMIPRIKSIIERTCVALGEKKTFMGEEYYSFPKAERLAEKDADFYKELGYGYRADYISEVSKAIVNGKFDPLSVGELSTVELKKTLLTLKGVGPKVADCVTLFGYHRTDSFPVDTWIEKIYREDFKGEIKDRKKIAEYFLGLFGDDSGIIQQYIFHYKRNIESAAINNEKKR